MKVGVGVAVTDQLLLFAVNGADNLCVPCSSPTLLSLGLLDLEDSFKNEMWNEYRGIGNKMRALVYTARRVQTALRTTKNVSKTMSIVLCS